MRHEEVEHLCMHSISVHYYMANFAVHSLAFASCVFRSAFNNYKQTKKQTNIIHNTKMDRL